MHNALKCCDPHLTIDSVSNFIFAINYDKKEYVIKNIANLNEVSIIDIVKSEIYHNIRKQPRLYG